MDLIIVGIVKCGTTSLEHYLKRKGHDVISMEYLATRKSGPGFYEMEYPNRRPVLIFRRDIQARAASYYNYYLGPNKKKDPKDDGYCYVNYDQIREIWSKYNVLVYYLEDLINDPLFPHLNRSLDHEKTT